LLFHDLSLRAFALVVVERRCRIDASSGAVDCCRSYDSPVSAGICPPGRRRVYGLGAVSAVSGVVTTLLMAAILGSVWLQIAAGHTAQVEFEQIALLALWFVILIPGLLCVSLAGLLARGELHAQKRTLAAAIVILGLTVPLAPYQATVMALIAMSNIAILLASRTNLNLSEPAA
jgi:hypothetical protein